MISILKTVFCAAYEGPFDIEIDADGGSFPGLLMPTHCANPDLSIEDIETGTRSAAWRITSIAWPNTNRFVTIRQWFITLCVVLEVGW